METTPEDLQDAMRAAGLRVTLARRLVSRVLADAPEQHLTADEIHERVMSLAPGVDKSTIQRTLDALKGLGLLHHVHLTRGPGVYHLTNEHNHVHLVCNQCGHTEIVPLHEYSATLEDAARKHQYEITSSNLTLLGRCAKCKTGSG